jgi:hypothetical protein
VEQEGSDEDEEQRAQKEA